MRLWVRKRRFWWTACGEWCRWCVGFVSEVHLFHVESGASVVRVLRRPLG